MMKLNAHYVFHFIRNKITIIYLVSSAVVPIWCCLAWSKGTSYAAAIAAVLGQILGLSSWLIAARLQSNDISVHSLGSNEAMLTVCISYSCKTELNCSLINLKY